MEDVIFERDRLQARLDAMDLHFLGLRNSSKAVLERLEYHSGSSGGSHVWPQSLLLSSFYGFVDEVASLVCDEGAVHCAPINGVLISASDSLELNWWFILQFLSSVEQKDRLSTASCKTSETSAFMPLDNGKSSASWV